VERVRLRCLSSWLDYLAQILNLFRARAGKLRINGDGGRIRPGEKVHAQIAEGKDAQDH